MHIDLLLVSARAQMSKLAEVFTYRVPDLNVEIIKWIPTNNEQYKLQANLYKYHDAFNIGDYFIIQIRLEQYPSETNQKLHVTSSKTSKMLQMVESNIYVINLPSNFNIGSTSNIKNLVIYKWQQHIHDNPFKTSTPSPFSFAQKRTY
jgi:hypothetical protein